MNNSVLICTINIRIIADPTPLYVSLSLPLSVPPIFLPQTPSSLFLSPLSLSLYLSIALFLSHSLPPYLSVSLSVSVSVSLSLSLYLSISFFLSHSLPPYFFFPSSLPPSLPLSLHYDKLD